MSTTVRHRAIPVLAVVAVTALTAGLAACGGDDGGADTTSSSEAVSSTEVSTAISGGSATTDESIESTARSVPSGPVVIEVTVGTDSSPDRVEHVPLGAPVELRLTNPGADDEFHLHDYDLGGGAEVPAGQTARFTFTADRAGEFELESHHTGEVYVVLEVS